MGARHRLHQDPQVKCRACIIEQDNVSASEAYVIGLIVGSLEHQGRLRKEGTLCDRHARLPHKVEEPVTSV